MYKLPNIKNKQLLVTALSHKSSLNEKDSGTTAQESNERLEFLGDAVLELATTRFLYHCFPKEPEGVLSVYRSALVKTNTLAQCAIELGIDKKMYLSKGEEISGGRSNYNLLEDTMEAVIGALYLDRGFKVTYDFLEKALFKKINEILRTKSYKDNKSLLQEIVQAEGLPTPQYKLVEEKGPDHNKIFTVRALVSGTPYGKGSGKSKQEAQQKAAKLAIKNFKEK